MTWIVDIGILYLDAMDTKVWRKEWKFAMTYFLPLALTPWV